MFSAWSEQTKAILWNPQMNATVELWNWILIMHMPVDLFNLHFCVLWRESGGLSGQGLYFYQVMILSYSGQTKKYPWRHEISPFIPYHSFLIAVDVSTRLAILAYYAFKGKLFLYTKLSINLPGYCFRFNIPPSWIDGSHLRWVSRVCAALWWFWREIVFPGVICLREAMSLIGSGGSFGKDNNEEWMS